MGCSCQPPIHHSIVHPILLPIQHCDDISVARRRTSYTGQVPDGSQFKDVALAWLLKEFIAERKRKRESVNWGSTSKSL